MPHPFAFFLARGWDLTNAKERIHAVRDLAARFAILCLVPEGCGPSWEFGYLISSARTRMTRAATNRQSMAMVIATRIQDDLSSNRPHLLCVGTARRSFSAACGPTARSSGPISAAAAPTLAKKALAVYRLVVLDVVRSVTPPPAAPPTGYSWASTRAGAARAGSANRGAWPAAGRCGPPPGGSGTSQDRRSPGPG